MKNPINFEFAKLTVICYDQLLAVTCVNKITPKKVK